MPVPEPAPDRHVPGGPPRARARGDAARRAVAPLVDPADAFLVAGLLPVVVLLAGLGDPARGRAPRRGPTTSLLIPAVLTGGAAAALHLVPAGPVAARPGARRRSRSCSTGSSRSRCGCSPRRRGVTDGDRARVLVAAVVTAFVAFTGVAALVPGRPARARRLAGRRHQP